MKYSPFLLSSLVLTGSALSTICRAQDEAPAPAQQSERSVPARPRLKSDKDDEGQISTRVREALRAAQTEVDAVQALAPGYYFSTATTPEMAKKTREITVLRQMVALKLSARDLERAIPLLKQLRDTDKIAPAKPEQALDEEYNALLRAKPGDPMPPSSSSALRDASRSHREEKQAIWDSMQKAIGREKTAGIRQMVRTESYTSLFNSVTPAARAWSGGDVIIKGPDGKIIERRRAPLTLRPADPSAIPAVPLTPVPPADTAPTTPRGRVRRGDTSSTDAAPGTVWTVPGAAAAQKAYSSAADLTHRMNNLFVFNSGQVSLDELIDLMEKKLAAMR